MLCNDVQCIKFDYACLWLSLHLLSLHCSTMSTKHKSPQDTKIQRHNFRRAIWRDRSQKSEGETWGGKASLLLLLSRVGRWENRDGKSPPPLSGCKIGRHNHVQTFKSTLGLCQRFNSSRYSPPLTLWHIFSSSIPNRSINLPNDDISSIAHCSGHALGDSRRLWVGYEGCQR